MDKHRNRDNAALDVVWGNPTYSPIIERGYMVPSCPSCTEPTYNMDRCPFCGQPFTNEGVPFEGHPGGELDD